MMFLGRKVDTMLHLNMNGDVKFTILLSNMVVL